MKGILETMEILGLRSVWRGIGEAGERVGLDGESPEFLSEKGDEFGGGGSVVGIVGSPLGCDGLETLRDSVGTLSGEKKEGVGGGEESGRGSDALGDADLRLFHAEEGFFVAEIEFDFPAVEEMLEDLFEGEVGIGTEEIAGIAVEERAVAGETIVQGTNDEEQESLLASGGSPSDGGEGFDLEGMDFAGGEGGDGLPGGGIVLAKSVGGGEAISVGAFASGGVGRSLGKGVEFGVLADASNEGGAFG